jgi:hypothetical protein
MTPPTQPEPSVAPLKAREVTAALRRYYPASVPVRSDASPDGPVVVRMGALGARYLGIGRDHAVAANLLGWHLDRPVMIASCDYPADTDVCVFTIAADPGGPRPVDPGSSLAVPAYDTLVQVLGWGQFPANRVTTGLIRLTLEAGCRLHLHPWRSGHGRQYRISLWHSDQDLLHGCIDAGEATVRFAAAYLMRGRGPDERRLTDPREVRQNLASCRDLHRARTAAAGDAHRLARAEFPTSVPPRSSIQTPRGGPASRKRAASTAGAAYRGHPRSRR